jgi:hypothetical protein
MTDTNFERKQTFSDSVKEIIKILDGVRMSKEFNDRMIGYFVDGLTAYEAVELFCQNSNAGLHQEIIELTNQQ